MEQAIKEKSVTLAHGLNEAMNTLNVVLAGSADEGEIIEAKNIVAGVLRNYKSFLQELPDSDRTEVQKLFARKIEALATRARQLP